MSARRDPHGRFCRPPVPESVPPASGTRVPAPGWDRPGRPTLVLILLSTLAALVLGVLLGTLLLHSVASGALPPVIVDEPLPEPGDDPAAEITPTRWTVDHVTDDDGDRHHPMMTTPTTTTYTTCTTLPLAPQVSGDVAPLDGP